MESQRNRTPQKFFGFHSFAEPGFPASFAGAFRDNIRHFLARCAEPEHYDLGGMPIWCTFLVYESRGTVLPLYTIEEDVKQSDRPFCDYCRCAGWSHHLVTKRKYHMIIPANDEWQKSLDEGAFDLQTHLLHGLIHCNGFGHLICINGIDGGSKFITGREIMDLWDRICTALHARQISVEDLSQKHEMDLRVLYGVAYGQSWFGQWGYRFCRGSFGVKEHHYQKAIECLSSIELDQVVDDFSLAIGCTSIKQIIHHYRDMSDADLVTIRDLFRFMLSLKSTAPSATFPSWSGKKLTFPIKRGSLKCSSGFPLKSLPSINEKPAKCRKFSALAANLDSRWPVRRLEHVAEVIVEALREKRTSMRGSSCGMTRQEARDAARVYIGDTGLIDHVLKVMNNVIVGSYIVRRAVNRCTKVLEYTIQDLKGATTKEEFLPLPKAPDSALPLIRHSEFNVVSDVAYLYRKLLHGHSISDSVKFAVQVILYSKNFVKQWPFRDDADDSLRFICRMMMSSMDTISGIGFDILPREYVAVPLYATVGDLKLSVQKAMQDTYCMMEKMFVTEILEMEETRDEEVVFGAVESGRELSMRCCGLDMEESLRYQGGTETWTVRCKCGTSDDDGERMVACDVCETWQHTRCSGIEDSEGVPRLFVCDDCCNSLAPASRKCNYEVWDTPSLSSSSKKLKLLYSD
ncbi:PHD finger protein MALE MEIOCYTE DEATH 1 [Andrographis paniculata]|uniref:PHD finger protein MALE MEIOCYTE DEATH 1 n=1 Tax=Andrographis paniculata TaxID=175694 RepID=UPI0021E856F9|nr:PHD finger protein MALE MEIOCYTE DEATH 1 [Andrographis paniculata]